MENCKGEKLVADGDVCFARHLRFEPHGHGQCRLKTGVHNSKQAYDHWKDQSGWRVLWGVYGCIVPTLSLGQRSFRLTSHLNTS